MVEVRAVYDGQLRCRVTHGPSGQEFQTDAPTDNGGEGKQFSPTDLVAAALASCVLTVMGIVAARHAIELAGASARVEKEMIAGPSRRIGSLAVTVSFPRAYPEAQRALLERAAASCPVHHSLHPELKVPIRFVYPS
ncbi:MAG: OsmC family protein [Candidatus Omnitrophica bacterium]|nr:OsmC family protein [Candidatus Omnitrophota bacterium]